MQDNKKAYVELKHIHKTFNDYKASDDVSFSVEKGKLIGLLGPSGSGKTTILRILAGLENADSGEIYIDGKQVNNIPASKREIGFVFQNYALFRYKSVSHLRGHLQRSRIFFCLTNHLRLLMQKSARN